jgi:putative ABC transport system permease protein
MRSALRLLAKSPGFSATVVIVLALGVGATTAIFSVVHAVLLHPFPYVEGNKILFIGSTRLNEDGFMPVTYSDFLDWQAQSSTAELAFASGSAVTLTEVGEPAVLRNGAVSASVWPLLGLQPVLGRVFTEAEDHPGAEPVGVISHALWQNKFHGDPNVLNRTITLDGRAYAVIGVMPPAFKFWAADVWTPVGLQADTEVMRSRVLRMDTWVVARPKPGYAPEDITTELNGIAAQLGLQYPDTNKDMGVMARRLVDSVTGPFRHPLLVLLGSVGCVLLIACANVANLLLARTATRQREYAVRAALGASRAQLIRQLFMETLPLALVGGAAGLLVGIWGLDALLVILPSDSVPAEAQISVNGPVMLFALAVTLSTLVLFALLPAIESSRTDVNGVLQEGGRGTAGVRSTRVRAALIVAEVSLSLALLVGAGLLIRSLSRMHAVNPGFTAENLLVVPIQLTPTRYSTSQQSTAYYEEALERVQVLPQVRTVAASTNVPFTNGWGIPMVTEGKEYTDLQQIKGLQVEAVMGDYFRALGLRLLRGRTFEDTDRAGSMPVIILNDAAVRQFLPEGDPIGKRVMLGAPEHLITPGMLPSGLDRFQWATVVGVVETTRRFSLLVNEPIPAAYIPIAQSWEYLPLRGTMTLLLRTSGDPLQAVPLVRQTLAAVDRDQPLGRIASMEMLIDATLQGSRFQTVLLGIFAGVALTLAVVGIYGVVAWNVAQRTREIGIRQALGAQRRDVLQLVIFQAMRVVVLGLVLGIIVSLAVVRIFESLLFDVSAFDPGTFVLVVLVLAVSALAACWLPARRATRIDPLTALRAE